MTLIIINRFTKNIMAGKSKKKNSESKTIFSDHPFTYWEILLEEYHLGLVRQKKKNLESLCKLS